MTSVRAQVDFDGVNDDHNDDRVCGCSTLNVIVVIIQRTHTTLTCCFVIVFHYSL
jgi:hypothetical protein